MAAINNLASSTALRTARDVINAESWAISLVLAKAEKVIRNHINSRISSKANRARRLLRWMARKQRGLTRGHKENFSPIFT